ncbi:unnamed protein product [Parajaminaea phylloscopi]
MDVGVAEAPKGGRTPTRSEQWQRGGGGARRGEPTGGSTLATLSPLHHNRHRISLQQDPISRTLLTMSSSARNDPSSSKAGHPFDAASQAGSVADVTSPVALRKLVLDYLLHHCYLDTAQAFAKDGTQQSSDDTHFGSAPSTSAATSSSATMPATERRVVHPLSAPPLSERDYAMEVETAEDQTAAGVGSADIDVELSGSSAGRTQGSWAGADLTAEDVHRVKLRQEIRDNILAGQIKNATDLLNANFAYVLNVGSEGSSMYRGIGQSPSSKQSASHSRPRARSRSNSRQTGIPSGRTSLEPEHLSLNLQIQAFVESVRQANAPQPVPPASTSFAHGGHNGFATAASMASPSSPYHSHPQAAPGIAAASISRAASPAPSSVSSASSSCASHPSSAVPPALQTALASAQLLYAAVQRLKNDACKEIYQRELEKVTAILAYKDLEKSPLKKYLDVKRRGDLADQINSAIMFRAGRPPQPLIECAVRQTTFVWSELHNEKVPVPVDHPAFAPPGSSTAHSTTGILAGGFSAIDAPAFGSWLSTSASTVGAAHNASIAVPPLGKDKKGKTKVPSTFALSSFLAER